MPRISVDGFEFELREEKEGPTAMCLSFLAKGRQRLMGPCVHVYVPISKKKRVGTILTVQFHPMCSVNDRTLSKSSGTVLMLKVALSYAMRQYPHVKKFTLQDESFIDVRGEPKPLITARRLLEGRLGWYEEHFGAEAEGATIALLRLLRNSKHPIAPIVQSVVPPGSDAMWWHPENVLKVCKAIDPIEVPPKIFGTAWGISRATVEAYDLPEWHMLPDAQGGRPPIFPQARAPVRPRSMRHAVG